MKKTGIMITIVVILGIILLSVILVGYLGNIHKATYEVNDENDDGRTFTVENTDVGYGDEYAAWALLQLSNSYSFGVKFDNVSIPQGATILEAYVELYSIGTPGHSNPNCKIYCDTSYNVVNFSTKGVLDICGRKYTHSYVLWNTTAPYDKWVKTISIVGLIQEVANRENWTPGNSMAVLFVSQGLAGYSAAFDNYNTGYPAKLYVEWR